MKQGDKGDHMYIILSGQANVHIANNTSFKNVVHAIQQTRMLAKLASSSRAAAQSEAEQSQASLSRQASSTELARSASQQAIGEVMLTVHLLTFVAHLHMPVPPLETGYDQSKVPTWTG